MFAYCRGELLLSEHEAYNRIEVARAARRFPVILDRLADGAVHLTAVRLLAPRPDVPASLRRLPAGRPQPTETQAPLDPSRMSAPDLSLSAPRMPAPVEIPSPTRPPTPAASTSIGALSPDRYKLQLTITGATVEKLRLAKDRLRHAVPSGDEAEILDRALTALLSALDKNKFAETDRPRPARGVQTGSRSIPAHVKRTVFRRDRGRCAFTSPSGHRCGERAFLELHHVRPFAEGGPATADNIELRCRRHNAFEWQRANVRRQEAEWQARVQSMRPGHVPERAERQAGGRDGEFRPKRKRRPRQDRVLALPFGPS